MDRSAAHFKNEKMSPGSRAARGIIRGVNRVITFVEIIVLAGLLFFGIYSIWDNRQIDTENTASEYEMYKPTAVDKRTYEDFRSINPDVCGWLTIADTGIDYPLVQGKDNDEYMNTTPDLRFALSGSIFLDYRNANDFSDYNTIIYGHHMEGPSMFGALDQYVSEEFFDNHRSGLLYAGGNWYELEVFAFLEVDAYDQKIYGIAESREEYEAYLQYIHEHAQEYRDVGLAADDRILVLSTCMTDQTNGRYIVTAKVGDVTDGPAEAETGRVFSRDGFSAQEWNLIFAAAGFGVVVLLILLYLIFRKRKRAKERKRAADGADSSVNSAIASGKEDGPERSVSNETEQKTGNWRSEERNVEAGVKESRRSEERSTGTGVDREPKQDGVKRKERSGRKGTSKRRRSVWSDLLDLIIRIAIIVTVVWVVLTFVFGIFVNSGVAMEPSIQDRDIILYYRLDNEYLANEAVVYDADGGERVGRIVARGGDTVEITDEGLKVNGYLQQDYKNVGETLAVVGGQEYPLTLAEDEFFILGDNREESTDSRMFGPVKQDDIKGSVMTVLRRRDV